jgi:hypothetical protein
LLDPVLTSSCVDLVVCACDARVPGDAFGAEPAIVVIAQGRNRAR